MTALLIFASGLLAQVPAQAPISLSDLLENDAAFVKIPAGEFSMGSADGPPGEQPVHRVRVSEGFEMAKYEVTQAQWMTAMAPAHPKPGEPRDPRRWNPSHFTDPGAPVESVSWDDVQRFLQTLNNRDPKHTYRLPTEAEWEYACRAGRAREESPSAEDAWYDANAEDRTHPVGQKKPNAWGLYDMQGNVWEWVHDYYSAEGYASGPSTDPSGPASGSYRVYRGGGWYSNPKYLRCGVRGFDFPNVGYYSVGFRLVRTPK